MSAQFAMPACDAATGSAGAVSVSTSGLDLGVEDVTDLRTCLAGLHDPRALQGRRYSLAAIVAIAVAATLAGSRGFTAIGEWAAGAPQHVLAAFGIRPRRGARLLVAPSETTIRKLLARLDAGEVARVLGAWLVERIDLATLDELVGLAVDGKSVRGATDEDGKCVHLLSAMLHQARITLAQREVDQKTNEITQLKPLLDDITLDTGQGQAVVFTADALHTQRAHAQYLRETKDWHFILPVAENQPTLFAQLDALDWTDAPIAHTMTDRGHGRIERRTIQVLPAPTNLRFPHVAQVILIERAVYDLHGTQVSAVAVLGITSLTAKQASPAQIAGLVRGHWSIEDGSHHVRDVSWQEDNSQVRTGNGPAVMAALRSFAIGFLRLIGYTNIAQGQRWAHRDYRNPLTILNI